MLLPTLRKIASLWPKHGLTLKKTAVIYFEAPRTIHQTTQRDVPENFNLILHSCEHLKYRTKHISPWENFSISSPLHMYKKENHFHVKQTQPVDPHLHYVNSSKIQLLISTISTLVISFHRHVCAKYSLLFNWKYFHWNILWSSPRAFHVCVTNNYILTHFVVLIPLKISTNF